MKNFETFKNKKVLSHFAPQFPQKKVSNVLKSEENKNKIIHGI